jgi:signal transduction histidine kinase
LRERFDIGAVLSLSLQGKELEGRLLALDKPDLTSDDLLLGGIVARQVLTRLEHFFLLRQLQQAAASEERIRLARDLHDGLLQSLTGMALQLETVQRLLERDPDTARRRLLEIQRLIESEQRDLRSHIRELKPSPPNPAEMDSELALRLEGLAERVERHWGLRVEVNVGRLEPRIPRGLSQEIYFIVHESLINAARHADASAVRAELAVEDNGVRIMVVDDGRGFAFRGRYDHADLTRMDLGPVTLKERVASLGGSLAIDSSDTGTRLEIALPLAENGG